MIIFFSILGRIFERVSISTKFDGDTKFVRVSSGLKEISKFLVQLHLSLYSIFMIIHRFPTPSFQIVGNLSSILLGYFTYLIVLQEI